MKVTPALLIIGFLLTVCTRQEENAFADRQVLRISDNNFTGEVMLEKLMSSKGFRIALFDHEGTQTDRAIFQYTPYHLDTADVDHDGRTDILVGLIKTTKFDSVERKRLFILQIDDGTLRPMWLGSKVCQELVNFKALENGVVMTLEKTSTGNFSIGEYKWQGFGLTLAEYVYQEISFDHAIQIFDR